MTTAGRFSAMLNILMWLNWGTFTTTELLQLVFSRLGPSPPHLKEHGGLHPGLEVGGDVCELVEAALLLLFAHAVIQRHGTLGHAACQHLHMICLPCNNNRSRATPGFSSTHADIPTASDNNTAALSPLSTLWSLRRPTRSSPMGVLWESVEGRNLADTAL